MKKLLLVVLCGVFLILGITNPTTANELDDQNIATLLESTTKVRSYGDFCWEMQFQKAWKVPLEQEAFRLYVMDLDVLRPQKGNYTYQQFIRNFIRSAKKEFSPGDKALIVCLPTQISFTQFKESIFKPWNPQEKAGSSKSWLFPKLGNIVYAKSDGQYGHTWLTGVRSIQDFLCLGKDDPRIIKIEGDSITFKPYGYICFEPTHKENWAENPFADKWQDENGQNLLTKRLEAGKTYTLTYKGTKMPKGWDD